MRLPILFLALLAALLPAPARGQDLQLLQRGKIDEIYAASDSLWLGIASIGGTALYRYDDALQSPRALRSSCAIDSVEALDGDGPVIYVGDRTGSLLRLRAEGDCEQVAKVGSRIRALTWDPNRSRLWIAAEAGLYTWSADGVQDQKVALFKAKALRVVGGTLWVGTEQGVWKQGDSGFVQQPLSADLNRAEINALDAAAGQLWIGTHQYGLHRWALDGGHEPIPVAFGAKQVTSLFRRDASLFIGSESGLFRVSVADAAWDPKIRVAELDPRQPRGGERLQVKWDITNFDRRTSRALVRQRVQVLDGSGKVVNEQPMDPGVFEALLRAPGDAGDYRLRFVAVDLAGREAFSEPVGASFAVPAGGFSFPGGWPLAVALLLATSGVVLAARAFFGRRPQTVERPSGEQPAPRPPIAPAGPPRVAEGARPADGRTTGSPRRRLRVFLCHSSTDKPQVRTVYGWLEGLQADPWLDHEKILPGQDWEREITVAVTASDAVLVCLSRESVSKTGYLQRELRFALDVAEQQPEGALFLIPVKLEECQPPIRLRHLHWVNLFEARGYDHLLAALQARADALGVPFGRTATSVAGSDPAP